MSLDSILNEGEEEDAREERELKRKDTELIDFLDESGTLLNTWHKALTLAKFHPKLKLYPGLDKLDEKIIAFAVERNQLVERYEEHIKDWNLFADVCNKRIEDLERWEVEDDEMDEELSELEVQADELEAKFDDIVDKGKELEVRFNELQTEVAALKE